MGAPALLVALRPPLWRSASGPIPAKPLPIGIVDCSLARRTAVVGRGPRRRSIAVARAAGIALISLGVACWPEPPLVGMLTYSAFGRALSCLPWIRSGLAGVIFVWPAVILHAILSVLLGRLWLASDPR